VYRIDEAALPRETLEKLLMLVPTADELALMRGYAGDRAALMECDQFFCALLGVPRFGAKVGALLARASFAAAAAELRSKAEMLARACGQVMGSERLRTMLGHVLTIGNVLNQGNARLEATAISLDSLLKLATTKGADKKTTLMDALVMLADRKGGDALLAFPEDLATIGEAGRIELSELRSEGSRLRTAVGAARREVDAEDKDLERMASAAAKTSASTAQPTTADPTVPTGAADAAPAPAEVVNPRAALLGQLLKARGAAAQAGAAPGAAASAAVTVSAANPAAPGAPVADANPCSELDRRHFVSSLRGWAATATADLDVLDELVRAAERAAADVAVYFGEEPRTTSAAKVITVLKEFAAGFTAAATAHKRRKASAAKSVVPQLPSISKPLPPPAMASPPPAAKS
jgi:hypothetical protein